MKKESAKRNAKTCYEHLGGKLGALILEQFVKKGWLAKEKDTDKNYFITDLGEVEFEKLGVDLEKL